MSRDTDGSTTVSDTRAESCNVASFMTTSETEIVVLSVDGDVLVVPLAQLLYGVLDIFHASRFPHSLRAVVGVAASAIPVALKGFRVEGNLDAPLLRNSDEEVASHPEVVTHGDALTWTDLELPLGGHNLSVDTTDVDAGVEASSVVGLNEITSEDLSCASTAIVGSLGSREAALWPTVGLGISVKKSVFLFETKTRELLPWPVP